MVRCAVLSIIVKNTTAKLDCSGYLLQAC